MSFEKRKKEHKESMTDSKKELVSLKNVTISNTKHFVQESAEQFLRINDFTVSEGESVFLSGKASSGKTLLLNILRCKPLIHDEQVRYQKIKKNSRYSSVLRIGFQPLIFSGKTVLENILEPLKSPGVCTKNKIIEHLNTFHLYPKRDLIAKTLARNELLALQLIRAVILLPPVLLVDDYDLLVKVLDYEKVRLLLAAVLKNGSAVIGTGIEVCSGFDRYFKISENYVVSDGQVRD